MKIFISHASENKDYGNALVDLLRGVGIKDDEIVFTSNVAYGIPIGKNIFSWLKSRINEKPFVIYLLSPEYYKSIACLNEMWAAWIVENEHAAIFTPLFSTNSLEFQKWVLDPREIGFYINDDDRLLSFLDQLKSFFDITKNPVIISQKVKGFLKEISLIKAPLPNLGLAKSSPVKQFEEAPKEENLLLNFFNALPTNIPKKSETKVQRSSYNQFLWDIMSGKFKDEEIILLHYIIETGRVKLGTGWQENYEVEHIKEWEDINELKNLLSEKYNGVIKRFELRKYTEVSNITSSGNPKEVTLIPEISDNILDLPLDVINIINKVVEQNKKYPNDIPF